MGYFDGLANAAFKKDAEGRDLFYPYGMMGKGRILPDAETTAAFHGKLRRFYKWLMLGGIPLVVVLAQIPGGIPIVALLGVVSMIGTWLYFRALTRDLPIAGERLGYAEAQRNAARGHSYFGLVMLSIIGFLMTTGSMFALLAGEGSIRWIGLGGTVMFGGCLALFIWMIAAKVQQQRAAPEAPMPPASGSRGYATVSRNDRDRA